MTKIILIEDEYPAAERLAKMVRELGNVEIVAILESVEASVRFFRENQERNNQKDNIDLIFSDIQLSDGLSFEIFEQIWASFRHYLVLQPNKYGRKQLQI